MGGAGIVCMVLAATTGAQVLGLCFLACAVAGFVLGGFLERRTAVESQRDLVKAQRHVVAPAPDIDAQRASAVQAVHTHYAEAWHELRTPMASVIGYLDLANERSINDPALARYVNVALTNAEHVLRLTEDILEIRDGGTATKLAVRGNLDLQTVVTEAVEMARPDAARRAVLLRIASGAPTRIVGDSRRLRQVVDNLLANAIKYTHPHTTVTVSTSVEDQWALVQITDRGPGMAPDEVIRMLQPYYRTASARRGGAAGVGLGMGIAQRIVKSHGGNIAIDSVEGQGTTVTLRFPQQS